MESAVIVRVSLPDQLDRLRQRCIANAVLGVPGHVTLLYPFVGPADLSPGVRRAVEAIASRHEPFSFVLSGPRAWPDTIYAAVEPEQRFVAIHRQLAAAFPEYPIYGRPGFELIPHVSIAEGQHVGDPRTVDDAAWAALPVTRSAGALEVIAQTADGRWQTVWTTPLGTAGH